jgi:subtilisin-like proprotein convertase family protein
VLNLAAFHGVAYFTKASRLAEKHGDDGDDYQWTFMTVRNWGESAKGTWRLTVRDRASGEVGVINSAQLTVYGSSGQIPIDMPVVQ